MDSKKGQGSSFAVTLPWTPEVPETTASSVPSLGASGSPAPAVAASVLLVEDNEANVLTVAGYLVAKGFAVDVARTGAEAISSVEKRAYGVILVDIQLPDCTGLEVIAALRASKLNRSAFTMALTALAMPGDRERCLAAGADDYMSKPLDLQKLVRTIQSLIQVSSPA